MNPVLRTRTASNTIDQGPRDNELTSLLHLLDLPENESLEALKQTFDTTGCLLTLRHTLLDSDGRKEVQDAFRRGLGFEKLLICIRAICTALKNEQTPEGIANALEIFEQSLLVLTAALENHALNGRYLSKKMIPTGWDQLKDVIIRFGKVCSNQQRSSWLRLESLFGILFATAVSDQALTNVYGQVRHLKAKMSSEADSEASNIDIARSLLDETVGDRVVLHNADVFSILVNLWLSLSETHDETIAPVLELTLPMSMEISLLSSEHNLVNAHTTDLFGIVIRFLHAKPSSSILRTRLRHVALILARLGVSQLADAYVLWSAALDDPRALQFLSDAIKLPAEPPQILFDLRDGKHASMEVTSLSRTFPPTDSAGYTFAIWARFNRFDPDVHTTLFGLFDPSQTCFVLAYLEKETHNLILQTGVRGPKPSIRFKTTAFEANRWYHIAMVHRRPYMTSFSKALLFVDGVFMEQTKATYPSQVPDPKTTKTQAFYGTPRDLSASEEGSRCKTSWTMASSLLFGDTLSDEMVSVLFQLGPRYHGNFQDCLGNFQTYEASTALNLQYESLHPLKEETSDIDTAIRQKGNHIIKEHRILLNLSAMQVIDAHDQNTQKHGQIVKYLSRKANGQLHRYSQISERSIIINGAFPTINEALCQTAGVGVLSGATTIIVPQNLDNVAWALAGCAPLGLHLVACARSTEDVAAAVDILLATIHSSWRNSEIMERDHGYSILATLLAAKLGHGDANSVQPIIPTSSLSKDELALRILRAILGFTGYVAKDPGASTITNALAYRILLIDCMIWRENSLAVQTRYFEQFEVFAKISIHHKFNLRRLTRIRVFKKLLESLKSEKINDNTMSMYRRTFDLLFPSAMSAEVLRSLSLFITFAIHHKNSPLPKRKSTRKETRLRLVQSESQEPSVNTTTYLSRFDIGVEMLRFYSHVLCSPADDALIRKFAKTVTNKWLLYLMAEPSPEVVVHAFKIMARLLVVHGVSYIRKFKERSSGFLILRHRLKRWWHIPAIWPICFAILFNIDVGALDLDQAFDLYGLLNLFSSPKDFKVVNPDIFEAIMGMLQTGLKTVAHANVSRQPTHLAPNSANSGSSTPQRLSMSSIAPPNLLVTSVSPIQADAFKTVLRFLADLHDRSEAYRDFAVSSSYVQDLLHVLYPVVVGSDVVDPLTELNARDHALTFDGHDVVVPSLSTGPSLVVKAHENVGKGGSRNGGLTRGSSYVLVSGDLKLSSPISASLNTSSMGTQQIPEPLHSSEGAEVVQSFLELTIAVFLDQILVRNDFTGLGLFLRAPPGFVEHQCYFESWVLRNTLSSISNNILLNQKVLSEPKVLSNLAKLFSHLGEALYEGWFMGGVVSTLELAGTILEHLQRSDIAEKKSVRLCSQAISVIRSVVFRVVLLGLSQIEPSESLNFLRKLAYWQTVLLSGESNNFTHLELLCYLLTSHMLSDQDDVKMAACDLWRIIMIQKPREVKMILNPSSSSKGQEMAISFQKLMEVDNETFLVWLQEHKAQLETFFQSLLSPIWQTFVTEENKKTQDSLTQRTGRRQEKLKLWASEASGVEAAVRHHEKTYDHWTLNIYSSETVKHQRLLQDRQDDETYATGLFQHMQRDVGRLIGAKPKHEARKWRLDQTEGRNRMRLRIVEDSINTPDEIKPRKKGSEKPPLRLDIQALSGTNDVSVHPSPGGFTAAESPKSTTGPVEAFPPLQDDDEAEQDDEGDESFELIANPDEETDRFEDKNRKVMRSLHHGDQVQEVKNISRVVGLEAVEGLMILGKDYLYLIDNFFQRLDGEILNVWQAPADERDPYLKMISGRDVVVRKSIERTEDHETRSWKWLDIVSVSKRRFLFRDVALEIFFTDGRSYLLTVISPRARDDLHASIASRAPQSVSHNTSGAELSWRLETLRSVDDVPQTLGSKVAGMFNQTPTLLATKKWQKGEMSNFHYLMLINTLAGRTFNDLTQYPVFPWVIADYTNAELDLSNPDTFRDLSKPMGCQTSSREAEFKDRYKSFAEMGDHNSPPFHYGTHYSSAMIVSSYLIRLQPFIKSYLLLQGGSFDHPDRMFFSIERAWNSASRQTLTDVRELIPEFYYLPEFLTNMNEYDFGARQSNNQSIGDVQLPPWAKGDPKIFIAKQREALESPHVSRELHKWIDLVFGYKQKGEAAVEAVNVFHHLSYQGAKDLDNITDPVERLATIGIIHNFGQTPYQVFVKPHPTRDTVRHQYKRLDTAVESLTQLPTPLLDGSERVASLSFSWKQERLLCSEPFRLNIPPLYDRYMEWGFTDCSVRFYGSDSRQLLGLFEHLHVGQLSCAAFVDSATLVTAGEDCTVSIWKVSSSSKTVELHPRATLFGHLTAVTTLAFSQSLSALLSASSDGKIILWDLNRAEYVREIILPVPSSSRDDSTMPVTQTPVLNEITCAHINDVTGLILLCRNREIHIYNINGSRLLSTPIDAGDPITSCAAYEGTSTGTEWIERDIIFTGHSNGIVRTWWLRVGDTGWVLDCVRQLDHDGQRRPVSSRGGSGANGASGASGDVNRVGRTKAGNVSSAITCILPMPQVVYTGDEHGRVVSFFPLRWAVEAPDHCFWGTPREGLLNCY